MAIPASIQNMIRRHKHPISPIRPAKLAPGQLRVVALETDVGIVRRTVLVIKTNSENGTSVIMMTHPYVELATDVDVVIPSSVSQLPYGLVVQTDCVGIMWTSDLSSSDGEFNGELEEVARFASKHTERPVANTRRRPAVGGSFEAPFEAPEFR